MKMYELTGYKNFDIYKKAKEILGGDIRDKPLYATLEEWQEIMETYGFTHLGTGSYGSVYEHPSYPWVFKVFKHDITYLKFYNYVRRNQHNPNLPKIKGSYIKIGTDAYAVRLEKLTAITDEQYKNTMKLVNLFSYEVMNSNNDDIHIDQDIDPNTKKLIQKYYGIYEITNALYNSEIFGSDPLIDLNKSNIMMRDNVPVFTDPVA